MDGEIAHYQDKHGQSRHHAAQKMFTDKSGDGHTHTPSTIHRDEVAEPLNPATECSIIA
ncbi:hypothetical protein EJ04DRAFT_511319 [Polyplosphaeria fusca]|uniref:Uncharacterized protein n=1 Tax=Polyplosphaeria fusca TaxID=682080 RepID=A0A9P4R3I7_9PLEO|nr:hypothetical protein EJ04DRAFT_511319 [Polyplosphaeria fusca]